MTARSEVAQYLDSIARYPEGEGDGSREALIQGHLKLVVWRAKRYKRPEGMSLMDLISVGNEALIEAADAFDPARGNKFSTLATVAITRRIFNYLDSGAHGPIRTTRIPKGDPGHDKLLELRTKARSCRELSAGLPDWKALDPFEECSRKAEIEAAEAKLGAILSRIGERDREVLLARFGGHTLRDVAKIQGVTHERIRQIQKRAMIRLRRLAGVA